MKIGENITLHYWSPKVDYTPLSEKEFHLDSDHEFWWKNNGKKYLLTIKKGFVWDGATVFRIFWTFLGYTRSGILLRASLPHDYIYINKGWIYNEISGELEFISRKHSDQLFYRDARMSGVPEKDARQLYQYIRFLGRFYWSDFSDWMPFKKKINK